MNAPAGTAPGREEPIEPESFPDDGAPRFVAVLVILVTLLGAVFALLHTQAGNLEASAGRQSQVSSVKAMAGTVDAQRMVNRNSFASELSNDQDWLEYELRGAAAAGGHGAAYFRALARAHAAASKKVASQAPVLADDRYLTNGVVDYARFGEDQQRAAYGSAELEKAYARERDAWSRKGSEYVTVITFLAVSLFLLGLSLTVQNGARRTFLWIGVAVALAGAGWGSSIWARSVEKPSRDAIAAYVEGLIALNGAAYSEVMLDDERRKGTTTAVTHFTDAIELRPTYGDAFLGRAAAHFDLYFLDPQGPEGSAALADYERAVELGIDDQYSRGSLAAAQWWNGDYDAATINTEKALRFDPNDLTLNLNYAEFLNLARSESAYESQLERLRDLLRRSPTWLREQAMDDFDQSLELVIRYRPEFAERERAYRRDLAEIQQEIAISAKR